MAETEPQDGNSLPPAGGLKRTYSEEIVNAVGKTAFIVNVYRESENAAPQRHYVDTVGRCFINDYSRRTAHQMRELNPDADLCVRIRTTFIDECLRDAIAGGCRQVLTLGAGFDTRALRLYQPGVSFYEVDQEGVICFKQQELKANGLPSPATTIEGNYLLIDLFQELRSKGFRCDESVFVIWEGNSFYIPQGLMLSFVRQLGRELPKCMIVMDHFLPEVITLTTGDETMTKFAQGFAQMGAPWVTGFSAVSLLNMLKSSANNPDNPKQELGGDAFVVRNSKAIRALAKDYYPSETLKQTTGDWYRMIVLANNP